MKKYLIITCVILSTACTKKNNPTPAVTNYQNARGTYVNFSSIKWYVVKNGDFATLHLKIEGSTNGDRLVVTTSGDGLITDDAVVLQSNKSFSEDLGVVFTANGVTPGSFDTSTPITVFRGNDTLVTTLISGKISY